MKQINFTSEHKAEMEELLVEMLMDGDTIGGIIGSRYNAHQLLHDVTIESLITINGNLKRDIRKIEDLDQWSMTEYQQRKLAGIKQQAKLINLVIGWKKYNEIQAESRLKVRELTKKLEQLRLSTLSPSDQMKMLEDEIANLSGGVSQEEAKQESELNTLENQPLEK